MTRLNVFLFFVCQTYTHNSQTIIIFFVHICILFFKNVILETALNIENSTIHKLYVSSQYVWLKYETLKKRTKNTHIISYQSNIIAKGKF